ncbi:MAG: response regulator [Rubrivivax sp.]
MCVDDLADAVQALSAMLGLEGAQVLPFRSGTAALEWFEREPNTRWPNLLVCDISLGEEMDGHQVLRRLRQLEAACRVPLTRRIPAIALTGHAGAEDRLRALMAGFQPHLVKPVQPDELIDSLATLAGRRTAAT